MVNGTKKTMNKKITRNQKRLEEATYASDGCNAIGKHIEPPLENIDAGNASNSIAGTTMHIDGNPETTMEIDRTIEDTDANQISKNKIRGPTKVKRLPSDVANQISKNKTRGPTKVKKVEIEFNSSGEPVGKGSVKLSSYLGPLVHKHVPFTVDDRRLLGKDLKSVPWETVQIEESANPSSISRVNVWIKSHTRENGELVNTYVAIRISAASLLPDEIILQILSYLSLKNLHKLKRVSKSWFSLITNEVLIQHVNSPNVSFYYTQYKSSKSLDFLPNNNRKLIIHDSCGGLVLCSHYHSWWDKASYYVCNPVDKSYHQILLIGEIPYFFMLDFNPLVSPHYKVIAVQPTDDSFTDLKISIYHSEKHCLENVYVHHGHLPSILRRMWCLPFISYGRRHTALWNGNVYLHCVVPIFSSEEPQYVTSQEHRIMMISGVLGGSKGNVICKFISIPKQRTWMPNSYLGTWRDRLYFVSLDDHEISVWVLGDSQEDKWTLEHTCVCSFGSIGHSPGDNPPYIVGLHPLQNAALFMFKNSLFAYDLDRMQFGKICEIGDDAMLFNTSLPLSPWNINRHVRDFDDDIILFNTSLVIPFSPCFANEVLERPL